jgi:predicted TIM-barrel fold metal-dependent hydrolase
MLIDFHVHAARIRAIVTEGGHKRPVAEELVEMLDAAGIDMAVVLSVISPECRYFYEPPEDVREICARFPQRLIPFCNLDPRMIRNSPDTDFRPLLSAYKAAGFKGVGEYLPTIPFDDPWNLNVFHQVEEVGFPLVFHIGPKRTGCYGCYDDLGLPRLERVLQECPTLKLVGHSQPFWAEISSDVTDETRGGYPKGAVTPGRVVELLRRYPNLYGDLSAGSGYNAITRDPEFGYRFLEEFQDRLFFGTDICHLKQELPIVPLFQKLASEKLISRDAHEKISWGNANRVLGLGTTCPAAR